MVSPETHVHPEPQNVISFGNRVSAYITKVKIKMRSLWIRVDPKSNDCPFIKQETTETEGRRSCEDRGRDGSDATRSQGMPEAIRTQKRQRRLPLVFRGSAACQHLAFQCLASRTEREYIAVASSHSVCGNSLWQL